MSDPTVIQTIIGMLPAEYQATVGIALQIYITDLTNYIQESIKTELLPMVFLAGFVLMLGIFPLFLWSFAVIRKRTKRTVFMLISNLGLLGYLITISVLTLSMFKPNYGVFVTMYFFMIMVINPSLHSSQVARSLVLVSDKRLRKIVEYLAYFSMCTFSIVIFALLIRDCRNFFKAHEGEEIIDASAMLNNKLILANIFFPIIGIISHAVFLYQTYRIAYGSNLTGSVRIKTLYNSTAIFSFLSVALYAVDVGVVIAYVESGWSSSLNGLCIGLILISEFLMDYSVFLTDFLAFNANNSGTKHTNYYSDSDKPRTKEIGSVNQAASVHVN